MASIKNDFGLNGKLGDVVFYRRGGKLFARKLGEVNNPNTEKQQEVRNRFLVAIRFYQKLKETSLKRFLDISARGNCSSGYTFYMGKNLKVFRGDGSIGDFSQFQFSEGKRERGSHLKGSINERGEVLLEWSNNNCWGWEEEHDRLMMVLLRGGRLFSPEVLEHIDVPRKDCKASFTVDDWEGESLHLYCFFISLDEKQLSTSQYICLWQGA